MIPAPRAPARGGAARGGFERSRRERTREIHHRKPLLRAPRVAAEVHALAEEFHRRRARQAHLRGGARGASLQTRRDRRGVLAVRGEDDFLGEAVALGLVEFHGARAVIGGRRRRLGARDEPVRRGRRHGRHRGVRPRADGFFPHSFAEHAARGRRARARRVAGSPRGYRKRPRGAFLRKPHRERASDALATRSIMRPRRESSLPIFAFFPRFLSFATPLHSRISPDEGIRVSADFFARSSRVPGQNPGFDPRGL